MLTKSCVVLLFLAVCSIQGQSPGSPVPLWDMYKWGSNYLAWCRFHCAQKISAGNTFRIDLSGITNDFKGFGNLKLLSRNGTSYIVENNYDIWGDGRYCQFQFGLKYTGLNLNGNCSFYEIPGLQTQRPSRGLDIAMWANKLEGTMFRYKGRCTAPCSGTYQPGTLRIRIDVDKATTNFSGYDKFQATVPTDSLTRSWTVVNAGTVASTLGLCNVDFQFDHQSEFPLPKGSCYVL